jgi:hypothetical protein
MPGFSIKNLAAVSVAVIVCVLRAGGAERCGEASVQPIIAAAEPLAGVSAG